jgi:hypothetical protein
MGEKSVFKLILVLISVYIVCGNNDESEYGSTGSTVNFVNCM